MPATLQNQNLVIAARDLNPSRYGEAWYVRHNILNADQFAGERLAIQMMSLIGTDDVQVAITPERIQVGAKRVETQTLELLRIGRAMVEVIDEPRYIAVGMNIDWVVNPEEDAKEFSRRQFRVETRFSEVLEDESLIFGANLSRRSIGGSTLTVNVRPQFRNRDLTELTGSFEVGFNYHFPVHGAADPRAATLDALAVITAQVLDDSSRIANALIA